MPIKPEKKKLYPPNWEEISLLIREQAGWKCELCKAAHDEPHPITASIVILTVHHINGDPTDNRRINLIALCQRCHNKLDQPFRRKKKEDGALFEVDEWQPTAANINSLPGGIKNYVYRLETLCDPQYLIRENIMMKDLIKQLEARCIQ